MAEFDVAIVGGGMVGASCALALSGTGRSVVLVEGIAAGADAQPSFDERTTALGNASRRIFESLGVWQSIEPAAAAIRTIHVSDAGHFGFARLRAAEQGIDAFGYVVPNRAIGSALWARLASAPGVSLRVPARPERIEIGAAAVRITIDAAWGLITLVIILGGILGGIFTAIEAGAVACIWAFFVTMFIYRDYKWRDLPVLLHRTLRTVAMVLTLIACASSVGYVMALTQMPAKMTAFFLSISSNKYVILFLINILLLVLGTLVDMAPSILIATPILLPVMQNFGVDPVHFGMIMLLNLGIGLCHPPVGSILFVGCAVGKVSIEEVMKKIWPFYLVMFIVLMFVTYIPEVSLWLPRHVLR